MKNSVPSTNKHTAVYYIGTAVYIILLYFFNNIIYANIPFLITKDYINCLWAINLALGLGIIGNFTLLLYRPRWFTHLVQAILSALGVFAIYIIYHIFPFTFAIQNPGQAIKIVLIIIMIILSIHVVIEAIRCVKALLSGGNSQLTNNSDQT